METYIHINWSGPYAYTDAIKLRSTSEDYGIYQVYGTHPVYGSDVLIYIGKADQQTFGVRLSQEAWQKTNSDSSNLTVYVGRLAGYEGTPTNTEWSSQITVAERILIIAHWPAGNSSGINVLLDKEYRDIHVLNWGSYRSLLPEVSGSRYSNRFASFEGYETFSLVDK